MNDFYMNGMISYEDDLKLLLANSTYKIHSENKIDFSYSFSDPRLAELSSRYSLERIANTKSFHALDILERSKHGLYSNCYIAATVLTECFLSLGVKAKMIRCMPMDLRYNECHCMVMAYVDELHKFVAFDPAVGGCYVDNNVNPLGLQEIRSFLINGTPIRLRSLIKNDFTDNILRYLTKNMFRFQCRLISQYGNEADNTCNIIVNLNPITIPLKNKKILINNSLIEHIFIYDEYSFWNN